MKFINFPNKQLKYDGKNMKKRAAAILTTILCVVSFAAAASPSTYNFLRNDVSARAAALGGSFVSMTDDPNAVFYNPSVLATLSGPQVSFGFFKHLLNINSGYASYGTDVDGFGYVGAGIIYINYGDFTRTNDLGNVLGTFTANELAISLGYATELAPRVQYGANVKFIYSGIAEATSTAAGLDLGVLYSFEEPHLTVGMSLLNLGTQLDPYLSTRESLPLDLKIGGTIQPEHLPLLLNLNFHKLNETANDFVDHFRSFSVGGEFLVSEAARLRVGFNNERRRDLKLGTSAGLAGFSFGGGVLVGMYKVDYAFNSYGKIGSLHRISLGVSL